MSSKVIEIARLVNDDMAILSNVIRVLRRSQGVTTNIQADVNGVRSRWIRLVPDIPVMSYSSPTAAVLSVFTLASFIDGWKRGVNGGQGLSMAMATALANLGPAGSLTTMASTALSSIVPGVYTAGKTINDFIDLLSSVAPTLTVMAPYSEDVFAASTEMPEIEREMVAIRSAKLTTMLDLYGKAVNSRDLDGSLYLTGDTTSASSSGGVFETISAAGTATLINQIINSDFSSMQATFVSWDEGAASPAPLAVEFTRAGALAGAIVEFSVSRSTITHRIHHNTAGASAVVAVDSADWQYAHTHCEFTFRDVAGAILSTRLVRVGSVSTLSVPLNTYTLYVRPAAATGVGVANAVAHSYIGITIGIKRILLTGDFSPFTPSAGVAHGCHPTISDLIGNTSNPLLLERLLPSMFVKAYRRAIHYNQYVENETGVNTIARTLANLELRVGLPLIFQ